MIWLWILAGLAAPAALGAWVAWGVLSWPYETWEGDENAAQTHQIDAHGDFDALPMGRHTQRGKTAQTTILEDEGWDG